MKQLNVLGKSGCVSSAGYKYIRIFQQNFVLFNGITGESRLPSLTICPLARPVHAKTSGTRTSIDTCLLLSRISGHISEW